MLSGREAERNRTTRTPHHGRTVEEEEDRAPGDRRLPLYFIEAEVSRDGEPAHHFFYSYDGSFE